MYYKIDKMLVLEFGHGDLCVATGEHNGICDEVIVYHSLTPHKIGDSNTDDIGKSTDQVNTLLRMVFHEIESIDIMIERLQVVRTKLVESFPPYND